MTNNRLITLQNLYHMVEPEDPQISPGGTRIAFVARTRQEQSNSTHRAIWIVNCDGGNLPQFTSGTKQDYALRWSPDGTQLAFTSTRFDKARVFIVRANGSKALQVTDMPHGVSGEVDWSLDRKWLTFRSPMSMIEMETENAGEPLPPTEHIKLLRSIHK